MKKLTAKQREQIRILFCAGGGREEWDEIVVESICAIIEGGFRIKPKPPGAPKISSKRTRYLERMIEVLTRRKRRHLSDRELTERLGVNRLRVAKARKTIKARRRYQFMRTLGIELPPVSSPLTRFVKIKK